MAEENENKNEDSEPSMDNILSSIRKILSEDDQSTEVAEGDSSLTTKLAGDQNDPIEEPDVVSEMELSKPEPINEVPVLQREPAASDLVAEPDYPSPLDTVGDGLEDQTIDTTPNESNILELTQQMIAQPPPGIGAGESILSNGPSANSTDALQELAKALLSKRDIAIGNKDMTLEGLVREILRPLLREWLDQNLPYLIERLVKKEIDHMVNRAERLDL